MYYNTRLPFTSKLLFWAFTKIKSACGKILVYLLHLFQKHGFFAQQYKRIVVVRINARM